MRRIRHLRTGVGAGLVALAAAVGAGAYGDVHSPELDRKIVAAVGTAVFVLFAVVALHGVTGATTRMWPSRLGPPAPQQSGWFCGSWATGSSW